MEITPLQAEVIANREAILRELAPRGATLLIRE